MKTAKEIKQGILNKREAEAEKEHLRQKELDKKAKRFAKEHGDFFKDYIQGEIEKALEQSFYNKEVTIAWEPYTIDKLNMPRKDFSYRGFELVLDELKKYEYNWSKKEREGGWRVEYIITWK